ncbi:MAG: Ada metal-binding domain-containing protein [Planctomycetota bacterium]|jgi:hypothetical protein
MKSVKTIFLLILSLQSASVIGKTNISGERFKPENRSLLAPANPALTGIHQLQAVIDVYISPSEKNIFDSNDVEHLIVRKLRQAGLGVFTAGSNHVSASQPQMPRLCANINLLKIGDSQNYAFSIETALAKEVYLNHDSPFTVKADLWKKGPELAFCQSSDVKKEITRRLVLQVDAFIDAHKASNMKNNTKTPIPPARPKKQGQLFQQHKPGILQYAASKNSKVFHRRNCNSVKSIKSKNLITYKTRAGATQAGKRPCKRCRP